MRESLASKLKTARSLTGMATRTVAARLARRFPISHATIANYESGRSVPPLDILSALAELYERSINWFLEHGKALTGVRYRNLKSRVRAADLHRFEADVQRWIDAYVAIEQKLGQPLCPTVTDFHANPESSPEDLSREVRMS